MLTVQEVYALIDTLAPFDTQLAFDNSGLLLGRPDAPVRGIVLALDVTDAVIDQAVKTGANLIITHHPMMFSARKRLVETDHEARLLCRLIRSDMNLISAHTNWDQAPGGVNDALSAAMGLVDVTGEGFVRVGRLPQPMTADALATHVAEALGDSVRLMGSHDSLITHVGMCSGSGGDEWQAAAALGAQAFVSGEIKHHHALEASANGLAMLECGHFATENPGISALAKALQNHLNGVKYKVDISLCLQNPYCASQR